VCAEQDLSLNRGSRENNNTFTICKKHQKPPKTINSQKMDTINAWADKLEGVPGYDMAMDWINEKAGEKYQTKDPFYVEIHGKKKRRKAPETCTPQEQKSWKRIKKRAWFHDRNFFGCYPLDLGLGMAPILAALPVIGPLLMFALHARLINIANEEFHLPVELFTKMHANIMFDLLISLPPILGSLFAWMNGCSTRNAALVHTYLVKKEMRRQQEQQRQQDIHAQQLQSQRLDPFQSPKNPKANRIQPPQRAYEPEVRRGRHM
jgi:hypothetical protein